ncbi:MAG: 3-oxoacyl-[acyl-carrier-protein] reductase [Thermodesulfovibrionales bacterium]
MSINGKTVIISGATRGIGRAIAKGLARDGANISFSFLRNNKKAEEFERELRGYGVKAMSFQVDIRDYGAVKKWVDSTVELFGEIDIAINNAGITKDRSLAFMIPDDWHEVINTNLYGTFNLSKACILEFMKKKKGVIVNISSVSGITGIAGQTNYSASKAGVIGFTKSLAREVAPYNIRVNAVTPGFIETDMLKDLKEEYKNQLLKRIPMNRFGRPEEVARVVRFLVSDESKYITGQTIVIDGGMS